MGWCRAGRAARPQRESGRDFIAQIIYVHSTLAPARVRLKPAAYHGGAHGYCSSPINREPTEGLPLSPGAKRRIPHASDSVPAPAQPTAGDEPAGVEPEIGVPLFGRFHDIAASERTEFDLRGEPLKPTSRPFGFVTQPLVLPARPANDIDIDPLEGRAQMRPIELAVVVDPAFYVRIVRLGQILQGLVAVSWPRLDPTRPAWLYQFMAPRESWAGSSIP